MDSLFNNAYWREIFNKSTGELTLNQHIVVLNDDANLISGYIAHFFSPDISIFSGCENNYSFNNNGIKFFRLLPFDCIETEEVIPKLLEKFPRGDINKTSENTSLPLVDYLNKIMQTGEVYRTDFIQELGNEISNKTYTDDSQLQDICNNIYKNTVNIWSVSAPNIQEISEPEIYDQRVQDLLKCITDFNNNLKTADTIEEKISEEKDNIKDSENNLSCLNQTGQQMSLTVIVPIFSSNQDKTRSAWSLCTAYEFIRTLNKYCTVTSNIPQSIFEYIQSHGSSKGKSCIDTFGYSKEFKKLSAYSCKLNSTIVNTAYNECQKSDSAQQQNLNIPNGSSVNNSLANSTVSELMKSTKSQNIENDLTVSQIDANLDLEANINSNGNNFFNDSSEELKDRILVENVPIIFLQYSLDDTIALGINGVLTDLITANEGNTETIESLFATKPIMDLLLNENTKTIDGILQDLRIERPGIPPTCFSHQDFSSLENPSPESNLNKNDEENNANSNGINNILSENKFLLYLNSIMRCFAQSINASIMSLDDYTLEEFIFCQKKFESIYKPSDNIQQSCLCSGSRGYLQDTMQNLGNRVKEEDNNYDFGSSHPVFSIDGISDLTLTSSSPGQLDNQLAMSQSVIAKMGASINNNNSTQQNNIIQIPELHPYFGIQMQKAFAASLYSQLPLINLSQENVQNDILLEGTQVIEKIEAEIYKANEAFYTSVNELKKFSIKNQILLRKYPIIAIAIYQMYHAHVNVVNNIVTRTFIGKTFDESQTAKNRLSKTVKQQEDMSLDQFNTDALTIKMPRESAKFIKRDSTRESNLLDRFHSVNATNQALVRSALSSAYNSFEIKKNILEKKVPSCGSSKSVLFIRFLMTLMTKHTQTHIKDLIATYCSEFIRDITLKLILIGGYDRNGLKLGEKGLGLKENDSERFSKFAKEIFFKKLCSDEVMEVFDVSGLIEQNNPPVSVTTFPPLMNYFNKFEDGVKITGSIDSFEALSEENTKAIYEAFVENDAVVSDHVLRVGLYLNQKVHALYDIKQESEINSQVSSIQRDTNVKMALPSSRFGVHASTRFGNPSSMVNITKKN